MRTNTILLLGLLMASLIHAADIGLPDPNGTVVVVEPTVTTTPSSSGSGSGGSGGSSTGGAEIRYRPNYQPTINNSKNQTINASNNVTSANSTFENSGNNPQTRNASANRSGNSASGSLNTGSDLEKSASSSPNPSIDAPIYIQPAAQASDNSPTDSSLPLAWLFIGVGAVVVVGAAAYFAIRHKSGPVAKIGRK